MSTFSTDTEDAMHAPLSDEDLEHVNGGGYGSYQVSFGDTIQSIAANLGVSEEVLCALNGIRNPELICPGMRLKYPC